MAKTGLLTLLFFIVQWPLLAIQASSGPDGNSPFGLDSAGFIYYKAWAFETGYQDTYLSQKAYSYEEIQQGNNWLQRANRWVQELWSRIVERVLGGSVLSGVWSVIFQLAPFILVFMLMGLLVWLSMKFSSGSGHDRKIGFPLPDTEEALLQSDKLQALVEEAMGNQDFRLALRYRYLLVLQHLIHRRLIIWKSFKTNLDYQRELQKTPHSEPFSEITRVYNFVWYGHFALDAQAYAALDSTFDYLEQLP